MHSFKNKSNWRHSRFESLCHMRFLKILGDKVFSKIIGNFWGYLKIWHLCKNCRGYFLGNFCQTLGLLFTPTSGHTGHMIQSEGLNRALGRSSASTKKVSNFCSLNISKVSKPKFKFVQTQWGNWRLCLPGTDISFKAILKTKIPLTVQLPLPTIGLELYQLGVHTREKRSYLGRQDLTSLLRKKSDYLKSFSTHSDFFVRRQLFQCFFAGQGHSFGHNRFCTNSLCCRITSTPCKM